MLDGTLGLYIAGFLLNFLAAFLVVRLVYYPRGQSNNFIFAFLAFDMVIYLIMGLFSSIELSIGAGFGLFALFSILRYRTETVPIREMTYLFVMAAMPILNSVLWESAEYGKLLLVDLLIILVLWILDREWGFDRKLAQMNVVYEKIELIKRERKEEMLRDLCERTGLPVQDFEVENINFLRDIAEIKITYSTRR
jgi:hypothetical protein